MSNISYRASEIIPEKQDSYITKLQQENSRLKKLVVEACKYLDYNLNCKGAEHFYDNEFKTYVFLNRKDVKEITGVK